MSNLTKIPMRRIPRRYRNAQAAIDRLCQAFGVEKHLVVPGEGETIIQSQLKCEFADQGDDETMRCQSRAHAPSFSLMMIFHHPRNIASTSAWLTATPIVIAILANGPDREVCRGGTEYEGIRADGPIFRYHRQPCAHIESPSSIFPVEPAENTD